jgi:hypothetical protein
MFRPEDKLYGAGSYKYGYDWNAFEKWVEVLRRSKRAIDRSRLELMERIVNGWRVDHEKKDMLSEYRERNRDIWSNEEKADMRARSREDRIRRHDDDEMVGLDLRMLDLSIAQQSKIMNAVGHSRELSAALNRAFSSNGTSPNQHHSIKVSPLNASMADSLLESGPEADPTTDGEGQRFFRRRELPRDKQDRVDKYLEQLSQDKMAAVDIMMRHFKARRDGSACVNNYNAPRLLVCGGPGNGKSRLVEAFDWLAAEVNVGIQVKCAFLGVAAVNIGGSSLCDIFDIPIEANKGEDGFAVGRSTRIRSWNATKLQLFKARFDIDRIAAIVVDEISMVKPYFLAYLNDRLQKVYGNDKPFAGLAVVFLGDFDQLPPVGGDSIVQIAMKRVEQEMGIERPGKTKKKKEDLPFGVSLNGVHLFKEFQYVKLTEQHRSEDPEHTSLLKKMGKAGRVTVDDLKQYKELSLDDMLSNDDFRFATIIVTGNCERLDLNASQAQRWASDHNTNVVRWYRERREMSWKGRPSTHSNQMHAMQNNCFFEMFVPGALGYLTHNINTNIGLANGIEIKYHSLSFDDPVKEKIFNELVAATRSDLEDPNKVITLLEPPDAINVELFADFPGDSESKKKENARRRKEWIKRHDSIVKNLAVIPITKKMGQYNKYCKEQVPAGGRLGYLASQISVKDYFPIEPGFSVTIFKAQASQLVSFEFYSLSHPLDNTSFSFAGANYQENSVVAFETPDTSAEDEMGRLVCCFVTREEEGSYSTFAEEGRLEYGFVRFAIEKVRVY